MLAKRDLDFLCDLSILAGLKGEVIRSIVTHAKRIDFAENSLLFREGEPAKEMAVVMSGRLEIVKRADNGVEICIATLGPGSVVGEMSLIDIQPRSAAVWARTPGSMVVLQHGDLASLYREDSQSYTLLVLNIAREISIRLRRLDSTLANIMGQIQAVTSTAEVLRGTTQPPIQLPLDESVP